MDDRALIAAAREAARHAYAPYSGFRVGAVVVDADGKAYSGANLENSAYPSTVCAEAAAIAHAVSSGARKLDTVAVACIDADEIGYPCGNCRQMMVEFGVDRVLVDGPDGHVEHTLEELIPHGFKFAE
ncbi:MAG: cytidine deaminase [Actinobacteria bacterium]|nr:cytidine deaminase [Actinomycetota bacterium]MBU1492628.1 cytidine deaminase [Actinomycetota bacterium]MBU1866086.1 cytidine deaminase [Actinomycetota bacterium]